MLEAIQSVATKPRRTAPAAKAIRRRRVAVWAAALPSTSAEARGFPCDDLSDLRLDLLKERRDLVAVGFARLEGRVADAERRIGKARRLHLVPAFLNAGQGAAILATRRVFSI